MTVAPPEVTNPDLVEALATGDPSRIRASLAGARFLVPAMAAGHDRWGISVTLGARRERIAWAFTDGEALAAWDRHPAQGAVVLDAEGLTSCLGEPGSAVVVLNAAGPAAYLVVADQLLPGGEPASAAEAVTPAARSGLGPLSEREGLRQQVNGSQHAALSCTESGDDIGALAHLGRASELCSVLGDRLHGAALLKELADCEERLGHPGSWRTAETAGWVFSSLGELDLGLECLVVASERARASGLPDEAARLVGAALVAATGPVLGVRLVEAASWLGTVSA
jgi:hypothetical protein